MDRQVFSLSAFALIVGLLAAPAADAVENGRPDRAHQSVGALGFDLDGEGPWPPIALCSGFVISDRAFVTAAHCILTAQDIAKSWAVTIEGGTPDEPVIRPGVLDLKQFNVLDFPLQVETATTTRVHIHPQFSVPSPLANDVAVLEFPEGTFSVRPVMLPVPGELDRLMKRPALYKDPVVLSGFGAAEDLGDNLYAVHGYRQWGFTRVRKVSPTEVQYGPDGVFDAWTLPGDSGSPQLNQGSAVSITSSVSFQRLDTPVILEFLSTFVRD